VEETVRSGLAAQIKAMRERMPDMTQKKFGDLLGNKSQSWVARLEDPNETPPTLSTLLSVAAACDVALQVRFAPFSEFADWIGGVGHWVVGLSPETIAPADFNHDPGLVERKQPQSDIAASGYILQEKGSNWEMKPNVLDFPVCRIDETTVQLEVNTA
jgi:hypothetical protein